MFRRICPLLSKGLKDSVIKSRCQCEMKKFYGDLMLTINRPENLHTAPSTNMWRSIFPMLFLLVGYVQAQGSLGVRVTYPQSLTVATSAAVTSDITDALNSTVFTTPTTTSNSTRNLRGDRQLCSTCACLCQGFAPRSCYIVYPWCPNRRRGLSQEEEEEEEPSTGQFIIRNLAINQTACTAVKQVVSTSLGALASSAALECFEVIP